MGGVSQHKNGFSQRISSCMSKVTHIQILGYIHHSTLGIMISHTPNESSNKNEILLLWSDFVC